MIAPRLKTTDSGDVIDLSRIGGSDIGVLIGASPASYGSEWDLQQRILHGVDRLESAESQEWMRLGSLLEPVIGTEAARRLGLIAHDAPAIVPDAPRWLRATPDYELSDGTAVGTVALLECKKVHSSKRSEWSRSIPDNITAQVQWTLHALAYASEEPVPYAIVAALFGTQSLDLHRVDYDPNIGAELFTVASEWWDRHIVGAQPCEPPAERLGPQEHPTGEVREATEGEDYLIVELRRLELQSAGNEDRIAEIRSALLFAAGDAAEIESRHGNLRVRNVKGSTTTAWAKVVNDLRPAVDATVIAEAAEKHTKHGKGRRELRCSWKD